MTQPRQSANGTSLSLTAGSRNTVAGLQRRSHFDSDANQSPSEAHRPIRFGCPPSTFSGTSLAHQDFAVGSGPQQLAFDGYNIWVVNQGDGTLTKLRASDGIVLGTYNTRVAQSGTRSAPFGIAFDGANRIWVAIENDLSVNILQASKGSLLAAYQTAVIHPAAMAYDGTNVWVTSSSNSGLGKLGDVGGPHKGLRGSLFCAMVRLDR